MQIEKFNPTKAELQTAIEKYKNLKINGIDDEQGYLMVKEAKKELADYRIKITKFGKKQREEALEWQREVLRQEKDLLMLIEPTEIRLKSELEAIDEEKKMKERMVLLPSRQKMLEELNIVLLASEILKMDEKEFSAFFTEKKTEFQEAQDRIAQEKEAEIARSKELEQAKKEAAKKAVAEERERAIKEAEKKKQEEDAKIAREKEEQEQVAKNQKYLDWLKGHNVDPDQKNGLHLIQRNGNTFVLYKRIDEITIN